MRLTQAPVARTKRRIERRRLLRNIINNLILLYGCNDTQLEVIQLIRLNNINISVLDFIKWARIDYRYVHDSPICPFDGDGTEKTLEKNEK